MCFKKQVWNWFQSLYKVKNLNRPRCLSLDGNSIWLLVDGESCIVLVERAFLEREKEKEKKEGRLFFTKASTFTSGVQRK